MIYVATFDFMNHKQLQVNSDCCNDVFNSMSKGEAGAEIEYVVWKSTDNRYHGSMLSLASFEEANWPLVVNYDSNECQHPSPSH